MTNVRTLLKKINKERHKEILKSEILIRLFRVLICALLLLFMINTLTVKAGSSTIQKNPKRIVRLVKKKSKGVVLWKPSIKKKIDNHQLHGNNSILYYHFSGNKTQVSAWKEIVSEIKEAKTRGQFPFDVCYLYYDGLKPINGRYVHQYSLYQTTKQVLANPNGILPDCFK